MLSSACAKRKGGAAAFDVLLTAAAELDLEEIYDCIAKRDPPGTAADVLDRIEETLEPSPAP